MISEALEVGVRGNHTEAVAMMTQMCKVLHQVALDRGDWTNAFLMWVTTDPLGSEAFGGDEREMH